MSVLIPQMGKGLGGLAERGMNAYYTGRQEAKEKETRAALGSLYGKDMGVLMSNAPETVDRIGAMQARDADQARAQAKADRESLEWDQGQADRNIKLLRERAEPMKQFIKVARDLPPEQRLDVLVETMRPHIEADPQFAAAISAKFEDGVLDDADLDAFEKVSAIAAEQSAEPTSGMREIEEINRRREAEGKPPMTAAEAEQYLGKKGGGTTVTINPEQPVPLDKPNAKDSQSRVLRSGEALARMKRIGDGYLPEYLTYQGNIRAGLLGMKDKAGVDLTEDERQFLYGRRRFTQNINREFNAYRKEITGAAASMGELESLKKAMLSEDLSPAEFEAAYNEYYTELQYSNRLYNRVLREGLMPGTDQFGERLDDYYLSSDDDDYQARADEIATELRKSGFDGDVGLEVMNRLKLEGYVQ